MQLSQLGTYNYLVPVDGTTHCVTAAGLISGAPFELDWSAFALSNFKFYPQGAFIDNTQGTGPLTLKIPSLNFQIIVPTGAYQAVTFPSPARCVMQITGANANAVINFVDFPVIPTPPILATGLPAGASVQISNVPLPTSDEALDPIVTAVGTPAANALTVQGAPGALVLSTPLNASAVTGISATVSLASASSALACVLGTAAATVAIQVTPDNVNWYTVQTLTESGAFSAAIALPENAIAARFNVTANSGAVTAQVSARTNNGLQV